VEMQEIGVAAGECMGCSEGRPSLASLQRRMTGKARNEGLQQKGFRSSDRDRVGPGERSFEIVILFSVFFVYCRGGLSMRAVAAVPSLGQSKV
jgi:hypothetical protein